jgi:hypothetical protein
VGWLQGHVFVALWVSPFATLGSLLLAIFLLRILDWMRRARLSLQYEVPSGSSGLRYCTPVP